MTIHTIQVRGREHCQEMAKQRPIDHLLKKWSALYELENGGGRGIRTPRASPRWIFKFEPPPPSPCRHRSSSLLIVPLGDALAGLKVRCRPMTHDGDSQEMGHSCTLRLLEGEVFRLAAFTSTGHIGDEAMRSATPVGEPLVAQVMRTSSP